jgi:hypothetical protein
MIKSVLLLHIDIVFLLFVLNIIRFFFGKDYILGKFAFLLLLSC